MAQGNFKQAVGSNSDLVGIAVHGHILFVATADTVYQIIMKGGEYAVKELVFEYEDKA